MIFQYAKSANFIENFYKITIKFFIPFHKNFKIFALAPKKFYIVDIGSVFGTYIRIKPYQVHPIEKGHAYLIGAETIFHITEKISKQVRFPKNR